MKTELPDTGHRFDTPLIGRLEEDTVILERVTKAYDSVRRRAYELFEARGRADSKVLDDWFRAEEELLGRLPLTLAETERYLTVHAEVHGFAARNIEVWVEPRRIVLNGHTGDVGVGRRLRLATTKSEVPKNFFALSTFQQRSTQGS